jgi:phosphoribosylanthranilate isomerase
MKNQVEMDAYRSIQHTPQVKICGLMHVEEALQCAELGVDAIGLVFHAKSPRNLSIEQAGEICRALPPKVARVGVFVDEDLPFIMQRVEQCGLTAVQLHGRESASLVQQLLLDGVKVIKAVFINGVPSIRDAAIMGASAYLAECVGGPLPGGNGAVWDWAAAADLSARFPTVLAGGLSSKNVVEAIRSAAPDAVDVSSGVESSPGRKNMDKVKSFLDAVRNTRLQMEPRRIF